MIDDMQVYIANLGKYNEGELVGDWFSFPLDEVVIEMCIRDRVKAFLFPTISTFMDVSTGNVNCCCWK